MAADAACEADRYLGESGQRYVEQSPDLGDISAAGGLVERGQQPAHGGTDRAGHGAFAAVVVQHDRDRTLRCGRQPVQGRQPKVVSVVDVNALPDERVGDLGVGIQQLGVGRPGRTDRRPVQRRSPVGVPLMHAVALIDQCRRLIQKRLGFFGIPAPCGLIERADRQSRRRVLALRLAQRRRLCVQGRDAQQRRVDARMSRWRPPDLQLPGQEFTSPFSAVSESQRGRLRSRS